MKLIIAGSRYYYPEVAEIDMHIVQFIGQLYLDTGKLDTVEEVVSGTQEGVDQAGEEWARANEIPVTPFQPLWSLYGNAAGPIRNERMAQYGDALLLIWDGRSSGSGSMLREADRYNLPSHQVLIEGSDTEGEEES